MENTFTFTDCRNRFDSLIARVKRSGVDNLVAYLEQNHFFTAPCSSQYHGAKEGGLLEHSVNVSELALKMRDSFATEVPEESVIVAGLLHDAGKASYYGKPNYTENRLKNGKLSDSKPYATNGNRLPIPHQTASAIIVTKFMPLNEEEIYAILYHNGLYTPDGRVISGKETPLLLLIHFSDMWASRFIEPDYVPVSDGGLF
jgi:putative nucleotidyltransferase with HDIG domain